MRGHQGANPTSSWLMSLAQARHLPRPPFSFANGASEKRKTELDLSKLVVTGEQGMNWRVQDFNIGGPAVIIFFNIKSVEFQLTTLLLIY